MSCISSLFGYISFESLKQRREACRPPWQWGRRGEGPWGEDRKDRGEGPWGEDRKDRGRALGGEDRKGRGKQLAAL